MTVGPGARVGPYEIRSLLGAGGMGEVFLARDSRLGRDVAVKVLPARFTSDPDRLRRFELEARAAGQLNHPNILTVYDVGTEQGQPYVVAERLEGESLRERLARGPLAEREALGVAGQIARGLVAAHARGIVHRDLKPENLFLTKDGHVKILDFGLAKLSDAGARSETQTRVETSYVTEPGVIVGTVQYMSPEQVKGEPVDHRADLFAFGVVLYEMLCGKGPFIRPSSAESISAVLTDVPPSLDEVRPDVSPFVTRLVEHCLEKSPDQRFQSARDLLFALESGTNRSGSGSMAPDVSSAVARRGPRRRRAVVAAALISGGLGLAGGWWATSARSTAAEAPTFARVVRLVATDALEDAPVLSPDGKWVAYASSTNDRTDVLVKFLSGGAAVNVTGGDTGVSVAQVTEIGGPDISPDGSLIAFSAGPTQAPLSAMSTYVVGAPLGGTPRRLLERGVSMRWARDGSKVVYIVPGASAGDSLWVAGPNGEHPREILPVSGGMHAHWPAWSADGRYVYFIRSLRTGNSEPSEIYRVPAEGGPIEPVVTTSRGALYPWPTLDGRGLLYSANPTTVELSLWWKPHGGAPVRLTTGVGEYAEARLSADNRTMVAAAYEVRRRLATVSALDGTPGTLSPLGGSSNGDMDPAVSPRGDRLVVSSTRGGDRNLWTMRLDGSDPRQVTSGIAIDTEPAWSPDGSLIAFVSTRGDTRAIWVVGADGGVPRKVTDAQVLNSLAWSPDGREIAFAAPDGPSPALFRVPVGGAGPPTKIRTPEGATSPAWSSSRNLIAYLNIASSSVGGATRLTLALTTPDGRPAGPGWPDGPMLNNGLVAWSADGRFLAGLATPAAVDSMVWIFDADGKRPPRPLIRFDAGHRPFGLAWLPDGRRLVLGMAERTSDIVLFDQGS